MNIEAQEKIRALLQVQFGQRQVKNPSFSLRAYAKKLELRPSALSEILRGKRNVSEKLARKILDHLLIAPQDRDVILACFGKDSEPASASSPVEQKTTSVSSLNLDQYESISKWYHFAILSLMETDGYLELAGNTLIDEWMAQRLHISIQEVNRALARLHRLGMIDDIAQGKKPTLTGGGYSSPDEVAAMAIKKSHWEDFEMAKDALVNVGLDLRDFSSLTLAIDPEKMPIIKKRIRAFMQELMEEVEQGSRTEVYKLSVAFFPLSDLGRRIKK